MGQMKEELNKKAVMAVVKGSSGQKMLPLCLVRVFCSLTLITWQDEQVLPKKNLSSKLPTCPFGVKGQVCMTTCVTCAVRSPHSD